MSLEKFIEHNNIKGDLAKILIGLDIELPEEYKDIDSYQEHLQEAYDIERDKKIIDEELPKAISKELDKKQKEWYAAHSNPLRNRIASYAGYDKQEIKDIPVKELLDRYKEDVDQSLKDMEERYSSSDTEKVQRIDSLKAELNTMNNKLTSLENLRKQEVETRKEETHNEITSYIYDREMYSFLGNEFHKWTCGTIEQAKDSFEGSLRRYGYMIKVEKNEGTGTYELVPYHKNGSKAMDLAKNKFVDLKQLANELAIKDKYYKMSNTDLSIEGLTTAAINRNGQAVNLAVPDILKG